VSTGRILVVDDTAENLRFLHALLSAEGYTVLTAMRGEVALQAARAPQPPELVLLDVRMPGMDGYDVCRRLKADPQTADVPVIFVSAGGDVADKVEAFRCGGVDYVTKPFQVDEVRARVATHLALARQRREIAALSALKDQLIRTISHDLRSPLAVVLTGAEALKTGLVPLDSEDARIMIAGIHQRGEDMLRLVTSLLDLARIEEGMPLEIQRLPLMPLLTAQAASATSTARARGVTLEVTASEDEIAVAADADRVAQVVANLLSNAIKYTPRGGRVTLAAAREAGFGKILVSDTGVGIPAESVPRLFEPFYRVPGRQREQVEGTGLGLSIVKAIVDQHRGAIRVDSEPGFGTQFSVLFPLAVPSNA
jgi:signal transduction histidine kinase